MSGTTGFILGIAISLFGSTASNLGVNVQKYSQVRNNRKPSNERRGYLHQPLWWVGLTMVIVGALCDFGALSFAPQSVIMPVGSFTLVANVLFAHFWLGEDLGNMDIMGTVLIVMGATLIAVAYGVLGKVPEEQEMSSQEMMDLYKNWSVFTYGTCIVIMLICFYTTSRQCEYLVKLGQGNKKKRRKSKSSRRKSMTREDRVKLCFCAGSRNPVYRSIGEYFSNYDNLRKIHPLSYAAVSGTMGSFSVVYGKSIGMLFANTFGDRQNEFSHPYLYISILCIVISVISQTHFLALGLKYFDALFIVPVFQCFFITLSILGGAIYWKETSGFNGTQWFVFILGVFVVLWGVFLMSSRDMEVDGMSRRASTIASDSYVPLDDSELELSDDVRRAGIRRRNTAGEFVEDAAETLRDAFRRPISILIDPELLNIKEGYFGSNSLPHDGLEDNRTNIGDNEDDVESSKTSSFLEEGKSKDQNEALIDMLNKRQRLLKQSKRRRTERMVLGFLPVFLNPDLDDAGTALGFGLRFDDFGDPFSLRNRMRRRNHDELSGVDSSGVGVTEVSKRSRRRVQTIAVDDPIRLNQSSSSLRSLEEKNDGKDSNSLTPLDMEIGENTGLLSAMTTTSTVGSGLEDVILAPKSSTGSEHSEKGLKKARSKSFAL